MKSNDLFTFYKPTSELSLFEFLSCKQQINVILLNADQKFNYFLWISSIIVFAAEGLKELADGD